MINCTDNEFEKICTELRVDKTYKTQTRKIDREFNDVFNYNNTFFDSHAIDQRFEMIIKENGIEFPELSCIEPVPLNTPLSCDNRAIEQCSNLRSENQSGLYTNDNSLNLSLELVN